jgi:hypothetical protein
MSIRIFILSILSIVMCVPAHTLLAATKDPEATPAQVDAAIEKAMDFLYSAQKNGTWEQVPQRDGLSGPDRNGGQFGGLTALCTYALLAGGASPAEPRLQKAIEFLRKVDMVGIYAIGLRAQVWHFLPKTPENKAAIKRDYQLLVQGVHKKGPTIGMYHYLFSPHVDTMDLSVSQYGVLGMWTTELGNVVEIPAGYWRQVEKSWMDYQAPDGGWSYVGKPTSGRPTNIAMTAAGVATLFITQDYNRATEGLTCKGNIRNEHIDRGMEFITKHFGESLWESKYTMYGIERVGVASGYKYFGNIDWYQRGANRLVASQGGNGTWPGTLGQAVETSFGILFLARGRAPVVMNKLEYFDSVEQPKAANAKASAARKENTRIAWNQRPRDAANVTRWIASQSERDLNWQIVNLSRSAEELSDAPILYIAGNELPEFTAEEKTKIKTFIENGGMIVANADCASLLFTKGVRKLGEELFPLQEFRELPADHVMYTGEQFARAKWRTKPSILAQSNGVREVILLIPTADPAKQWQIQSDKGKEELFQLMANIFLYSVDKQGLQYKGKTHLVSANPKITATRTIKIARLQYSGNWNPEPAGWRRLGAVMHNDKKTDLAVDSVELGQGKLKDYKVAHMTGTTKFRLDDAARAEIKAFVEAGGTLIIDAAGGSGEFASSAEGELRAIFPAQAAELNSPLPDDNAIYTLAGSKIAEFGYRTYARSHLAGSMKAGRLRGMKINGRLAVFFSPEDISAGLIGKQVDGIIGYDPETATHLMENILLYSNGSH